jgi:hypothetical protein
MKIKRFKYIDSAVQQQQTSEPNKPFYIDIVGFLVEETDEHITLAMEVFDNKDYRFLVSIPKVAIIK